MPKISVVVPVYNVEDYLEGCVASVLSQTEGDLELLLIDDGSTDGSGALCDRLAGTDGRMRVIHQANCGLGGARNTGIEAAAGEWLMFVDSDDTLEPDALAFSLELAERTGAEMAAFSLRSVDEQGRSLRVQTPLAGAPEGVGLSPRENRELLLCASSACAKLYRAEVFRHTGIRFPPKVWYEDVRTVLKLLPGMERVALTSRVGYNYLKRSGSIMNTSSLGRNREIMDAFDDLLGWYRAEGLAEEYREELCFLTVSHILMSASIRVLRSDPACPLLKQFKEYTERQYPDYRGNRYMDRLDWKQKMILRLVERDRCRLAALIFRLRRGG